MYEFWYDYIEPKYQNNAKNAKLFHMDTDSFIAHIKTEDFCKDVVGAAAKRYDTSDHKADRPLPKEMDKKVIDLMKDELKGKIIKEFITARPKTYSYLTDDDRNVIKTKGTKKSMIKRILNFDDYKDCLFKNEIILKSKQRFKVKQIVYILKKSIRLHKVVVMIKDYKLLIELEHIHMEQMLLKYVKVRC